MIDFSHSVLAVLPVPLAVVRDLPETLNHPVVFLNAAFSEQLGWDIKEIPAKATWWKKAYPDLDYQAVVSRQWELACEMAEESGDHFVVMEVNITTKHKGEKRFRVYSEQSDVIVDGCYLLIFEPVA